MCSETCECLESVSVKRKRQRDSEGGEGGGSPVSLEEASVPPGAHVASPVPSKPRINTQSRFSCHGLPHQPRPINIIAAWEEGKSETSPLIGRETAFLALSLGFVWLSLKSNGSMRFFLRHQLSSHPLVTYSGAHASRDHTLVGPLWEGYHESRRCSRDTYPESYITKHTSIRR